MLTMKLGFLAMVGIAGVLSGCSVELPVAEATARPATDAEVQRIIGSGDVDGLGSWTAITAVVDRETVERIAGWQLYTHMPIVDCVTGASSNIASNPTIDGVSADDFHALDRLLAAQSGRSVFRLEGFVFARPPVSWQRQCLQLDGGSYTFQTIASDRVPIRFTGAAG